MTPGEGIKGSDIYRGGNQEGDGVQVSVIIHITMVTGVRHNEQPGDLEAGHGAHVTPQTYLQGVDASSSDRTGMGRPSWYGHLQKLRFALIKSVHIELVKSAHIACCYLNLAVVLANMVLNSDASILTFVITRQQVFT